MSMDERRKSLSNRLIEYSKDYNYYEYKDCYDTDEDAYNDYYDQLGSSKKIQNILYEIGEDFDRSDAINNEEQDEELEKLYQLHKDLFLYKKDLKKLENECEVR